MTLTPSCHNCERTLAVGEYAWSDSWVVVDSDGARHENRYYCDDCEAKR